MRTLNIKFVGVVIIGVLLFALGSLAGCTVVTGSEGSLYVRDYKLYDPWRAAYNQPFYWVETHNYNVNLTAGGRLGSDWRDGWPHGNYGHGGWSDHGWSGRNPRRGWSGDCR